ncbi:alpha/beta fold hydrolase [Sorangium sp. So ce1151]|uniref:alpha/beta fold hydrolase n=1 Tax=Sorangium sp. So ce1151 TaxID=3133332 RepID=UPI003F62F675
MARFDLGGFALTARSSGRVSRSCSCTACLHERAFLPPPAPVLLRRPPRRRARPCGRTAARVDRRAILVAQPLRDYRLVPGSLAVPSLVVMGRDEKLVPVAAGEHLVRHLPEARPLVVEGSGHCPFLEEPDRFNEEVHLFIRSLP